MGELPGLRRKGVQENDGEGWQGREAGAHFQDGQSVPEETGVLLPVGHLDLSRGARGSYGSGQGR